MEQVKGLLVVLLFVLALAASSAFSAPVKNEGDDGYCETLLSYLGIDEQIANLRALGQPVPEKWLSKRAYLATVIDNPVTTGLSGFNFAKKKAAPVEAAEPEDTEETFVPYKEWSPGSDDDSDWKPDFDDQRSEWSPEGEEERAAQQNNPTESEFFSLDRQMALLESYLEMHGTSDAEAYADTAFRRVAAERMHKGGLYRLELERTGILDASQQRLALELWIFEYTRRYTTLPERSELLRFGEALNGTSETTLRELALLSFGTPANPNRPRPAHIQTLHDIIESVAKERFQIEPDELVRRLQAFYNEPEGYLASNAKFGQLLHNYLGLHDALYGIYDNRSLEKFMNAHQD